MIWTNLDIKNVLSKLEVDFKSTPNLFFSEHDIHAHLIQLVKVELNKQGHLFVNSKDEKKTYLTHLEYPTPFRCDMRQREFRVVSDTERTPKGGLFRRGHFDLVVLNPEFVRRYPLIVVAGKNHAEFSSIRDEIDVTPLLWVCEVIFGAHIEDDLPRNWINYVTQDAMKVIETLNYVVGKDIYFVKHGSVLVFTGVASEKTMKLERDIKQFTISKGFGVKFYSPE